ncbi:MAG TPA: hypothetical protein VMN36_12265 [Verrucomicrobiales bacterium]|nr:hypothetical protein [Verrucomicrobiales bacterium]
MHPGKGPLSISLGLFEDGACRSAAENMACDEVLLRRLQMPLLRIYSWRSPAVSLGYFVDWEEGLTESGRELVRRWTGGGLVLHEPDGSAPTYSLLIPRGHPWHSLRPRELYRMVHSRLAKVLEWRRIPAELHLGPEARPGGWCFQEASVYDIVARDHGAKIAGAGQRRTRQGTLLQGNLRARLGEGWAREFAAALDPGWKLVGAGDFPCIDNEVDRCVRDRYGTDAWLRGLRGEALGSTAPGCVAAGPSP